jgi:hypothetical protein
MRGVETSEFPAPALVAKFSTRIRRTVTSKPPFLFPVRLVCVGLLSLSLVQCDESATDGRAWVSDGHSDKLALVPDGVLYVDKTLPEVVKRNYRGYIGFIASSFKDNHLFNLDPVPLVIYFMPDAERLARYCSLPADGSGVFVPRESSIYVHSGANPLLDNGVLRCLIRDIARAVIFDMYGGDYPAWMEVGGARMFADGAFGPSKDPKAKAFAWFVGVPEVQEWRPTLGGDLPSFEEVRTASPAELAKLGHKGAAVATAAVYLLKQLEQFRNVVWAMQPTRLKERDPRSVLEVIKGCDPRYDAHFEDPVAMMFKLRPDVRVYLECEVAGDAADLSRVETNTRDNPKIAGYWWQYARLLLQAGREADAIEALESCRGCDPSRHHAPALTALARIYYKQKDWARLKPVVLQQLMISVLPTPTMHLMLAESARKENLDEARRNVRQGLELPARGFEADVARLKELAAELESR